MKKFLSMALVVVMTLALFATVPITAEAKQVDFIHFYQRRMIPTTNFIHMQKN